MSVAGVRAGGAFVEIFANDSKFQQAMVRVQNRLQSVGQTMQRIGTGMSIGGAALGAPLILAGRQAAGFEDAILAMQGAAGLGQAEIKKLSDAAKQMGTEMGISPTKLAQAFLELTKAGMSVEDVLAGAGKAAVEFSKVGGVDAERAAVFMKAAMNVFGVSAKEAVDTLTAAANSSETSIDAMVESFSQVGSAGKAFNQTLFGISQAMAVLAKSTIVGEEAGTAIKTMLTKLIAPTKDAEEALGQLGLKVSDFRDEAGRLLPMQQIAGVFQKALGKMGGNPGDIMASQQALVDVFEQRGIKVMSAFANAGEEGFKKVAEEMQKALPVADQFTIAMSGLSGQASRLGTGVEQMSIAFGEAVKGPFKEVTDILVSLMDTVARLIKDFPVLAVSAGGVAAGLVAIGAAAIAAGIAMRGFAQVSMVLAALSGPRGWIALAAIALGGLAAYMATSFKDAKEEVQKAKKEVEGLGKGAKAGNSIKPDENRNPMQGDPFAARKAAEELAKEDQEDEDAQARAIERLKKLQYDIVEQVGGLGEAARSAASKLGGDADAAAREAERAGFNAAANYQGDIEEVIRQVEAGIANPQMAEVLAKRAKDVFDADIKAYRESLEEQTRDFGDSAGTFGNNVGLGIGPRLAKFFKKTTIEFKKRAEQAVLQAAAGDAGEPGYGPNPEWLARQAARAKAGTEMAEGAVKMSAEVRGGLDSVVNAVMDGVKATEKGNGLLQKILDNSGRGLAFQ